MRLVTYSRESAEAGRGPRLGALHENGVVDLRDASESLRGGDRAGDLRVPSTMMELLCLEDAGMEAARAALAHGLEQGIIGAAGEARLHSPLPRPSSLRDFMTVEQHLIGCGATPPDEWYNIPAYWKGNPEAVFGPDDDIRWPHYAHNLDFEFEVGAVIGRRGTRIPRKTAESYIAGYTIFNDWSARDIQRRESEVRVGPGLGKDFATSLGPCLIVSADFDPYSAPMRVRVNGELWSEGDMSDMRWTFDELVSHLSEEQVLVPGDVLGSGTMGNGCCIELKRTLHPGDVVELEVEGLGTLANRIVPRVPLPSEDFGAIRDHVAR